MMRATRAAVVGLKPRGRSSGLAVSLGLLVLSPSSTALADAGEYSIEMVEGFNQGVHDLGCRIIRPWGSDSPPASGQYPVVFWSNGWGGSDVYEEELNDVYLPGLIELAVNIDVLVVQVSAWDVQERDLQKCVTHVLGEDGRIGSPYFGLIDETRIGLTGHSQGGGVSLGAGGGFIGDGEAGQPLDVKAVVAMNPWWVLLDFVVVQQSPVLLLAGAQDQDDVSRVDALWGYIETNGIGGSRAILERGTHAVPAVFDVPLSCGGENRSPESDWAECFDYGAMRDFGEFQRPLEAWFDTYLNGNQQALEELEDLLTASGWDAEFAP